jgi:hypothetical protein
MGDGSGCPTGPNGSKDRPAHRGNSQLDSHARCVCCKPVNRDGPTGRTIVRQLGTKTVQRDEPSGRQQQSQANRCALDRRPIPP